MNLAIELQQEFKKGLHDLDQVEGAERDLVCTSPNIKATQSLGLSLCRFTERTHVRLSVYEDNESTNPENRAGRVLVENVKQSGFRGVMGALLSWQQS